MSSPWAQAQVEATLDYGNIDSELRARLERSVAIATRACEQHFKRLERTARQAADRSATHFDRAARQIQQAGDRAANGVERSLSAIAVSAQRHAARMADTFQRQFTRIVANAHRLREHINAALRGIDSPSIQLRVDAADALADLRGVHRQLQNFLDANPLTARIRVDVDAGTADAELARVARDRRTTLRVDVDRSAMSRLSGMGGGSGLLGKFGDLSKGALSAVAGVGMLAAKAGAATLAVGSLVPVLAALGSALVAVGVAGSGVAAAGLGAALVGVAALKTGVSGISDAIGAIGKSSAAGGGVDAADKAHQVEQAQKALTRAVRDEKQAQMDVAAARKSALERLEDLNLEMRGAALSERDAVLSLKEAQADLAKGGFQDGNARDRAVLRVDEAEQRLLEVRERNKDLANETADAERKGVERSDEVVAAKQKLADATDSVREAQYQLNAAQKNASGGGVDKLGEAMAKLAPNARSFVQTLIDLQPAWTAVQQRVQDRLFADLAGDVRQLAGNYLPALGSALVTVVAGFNDGARSALGFANSATGVSVISTLLSQSAAIAGNFGRAVGNLLPGLSAIGASAANVFAPLTSGMAAAATGISDSLIRAQQSGQLDATFTKALDVAKQLGAVLGEVGGILAGVFRAAETAGGGNGLANITATLSTIGDFVNSPAGQGALTSFFQSAGQVMSAVLPLLMQVAQIIGTDIAPIIADLFTQLAPSIQPLLAALGAGISALAPAVGPLAAAFASIATALVPIMPILGQLIAKFIELAGPIIGALAQALGPILATVGQALIGVLQALMPAIGPLSKVFVALSPVIAQIAGILGKLLVGAITALMPVVTAIANAFVMMLPALQPLLDVLGDVLMQILAALAPMIADLSKQWLGVITALMPLMPVLTQIVVALLPPLVEVITALLPLLTIGATMFTNIVTAVAPLLVQIAQLIAFFAQLVGAIYSWAADAITAVVGFVTSVVGFFSTLPGQVMTFVADMWNRVVTAVGDGLTRVIGALSGLGARITTAVGGIWTGLVDGFKSALNSLIKMWNDFKLDVDFKIPVVNKRVSFTIDTPNIPMFGAGGTVPALPGSVRGRDSILAGIMPGEFIEPERAVTPATLPILEAIRSGWTPTPAQLSMLFTTGALPGYAGGGLISRDQLTEFAKGVEGAPYQWGGVQWGDCSGAVSAVANFATGRDPFGSRFATATEAGELEARGFQPGLGPAGSLSIGWFNGGPAGGHTAATLPDGTHFEMGGARGNGQFGGAAVGADDPQFTDHAHLPPDHFRGLDGGAPTSGGGLVGSAPSSTVNGGASSSAAASPAAGGSGGGSASMPFGAARANTWLGEQDMPGKAKDWGVSAIKEIGGGVLAPLGVDAMFGSFVDRVVKALETVQPPPAQINVTDRTRGGVAVSGTPITTTTYRGG